GLLRPSRQATNAPPIPSGTISSVDGAQFPPHSGTPVSDHCAAAGTGQVAAAATASPSVRSSSWKSLPVRARAAAFRGRFTGLIVSPRELTRDHNDEA